MTSNSAPTTREIAEQLFAVLRTPDPDTFVALMAEDAVFEIPFVVPGMPQRIEGREAIREHLSERWAERAPGLEIHGVYPEFYETTDPDTVLVENDVDITPPGGERVRFRGSVNVIRVRDGKVVLFRDYMDTARVAGLATR